MQAVIIQINYPILESPAFRVPQPRGADYGTLGGYFVNGYYQLMPFFPSDQICKAFYFFHTGLLNT